MVSPVPDSLYNPMRPAHLNRIHVCVRKRREIPESRTLDSPYESIGHTAWLRSTRAAGHMPIEPSGAARFPDESDTSRTIKLSQPQKPVRLRVWIVLRQFQQRWFVQRTQEFRVPICRYFARLRCSTQNVWREIGLSTSGTANVRKTNPVHRAGDRIADHCPTDPEAHVSEAATIKICL